MTTVTAAQLVYANLEAHESPSGFRGFQVWLASRELDDATRAEVARQLADFSLPQELDPGSKRARALQRHAFYRVEVEGNTWWVVARTVPTDDRDMYGRTGLFLAHAFVLSDADFRRVHCDPFTLLDAEPPFFGSKQQVRERVPDRNYDEIPAAQLQVRSAPVRGEFDPTLVLEFARFLEDARAAPVVVPEEPAVLLNMLRPIFAWLPPVLRGRAAFDTLFTGQSLGHAPFRIVGTFSPDALSTWSDQRYHQWMRSSEAFVPPLQGKETFFTRRLAAWLDEPFPQPEERTSVAFELLHAVEDGRLDDCQPHGLSEDALRELFEDEPVRERLKRLRTKRIEVDFPERALWPLIKDRLPEYFRAESWPARLDRIARPVAAEQIAAWLRSRLEDVGQPAPNQDELTRLLEWLKPHRGEDAVRCRLMTQRWQGDILGLHLNMTDQEQADPEFWFWPWCRKTLERRHGGAEQATSELLSALRGEDASLEALTDAELLIEIPKSTELAGPAFERAEVEFQLAYHRTDVPSMSALLEVEGNRPLYVQGLRRLERAPVFAAFCCFVMDGEFYLGARVEFPAAGGTKAAALAAALFQHQPYHAVEHWRHAAMQGDPPAIEQQRVSTGCPNSTFLKLRDRRAYEDLTVFLRSRGCTDSIFQDCVESMLGLRVIAPTMCPVKDTAIWVGLKLTWAVREQASAQNHLLEAVLRSIGPVFEVKSWPEVAACDAQLPVDRPRLGWLLMCLLNPTLVGRLSIARM